MPSESFLRISLDSTCGAAHDRDSDSDGRALQLQWIVGELVRAELYHFLRVHPVLGSLLRLRTPQSPDQALPERQGDDYAVEFTLHVARHSARQSYDQFTSH